MESKENSHTLSKGMQDIDSLKNAASKLVDLS